MASNFWEGEFYFDGDFSNNHKVCMIDFNSRESVKQIGGTHVISTEKDNSYNDTPFYKVTERTMDNIILQLCKTDKKPWTTSDIQDITKWLFKENFKQFQPVDSVYRDYNIVYYLKAIDMKKFLNPNMEGFLEITFQSYDGYAYIIPWYSMTVNPNGIGKITSLSNVEKKYLPKIKITSKTISTEEKVVIKNTTNGDILTLKGMNNEEVFIIDCAIGSVVSFENNINRFSILQDYNFIGLEKGDNYIQVTGNAKIEFICEFPIII